MVRRRAPAGALAALSIALVAICLAGCGGSSGNSESFKQIVTGLHRAALAHRSFDAVSRAEGLKPIPRATIKSFCETNKQMVENHEAWKVKDYHYYYTRVRNYAEQRLPFFSSSGVEEEITTMQKTVNFPFISAKQLTLYVRPCYA